MSKKPIHTVHDSNGGWKNVREGASRAPSTHTTKSETQTAGRDQARRDSTEHVIHNMDERIAQRNSYGDDPHPPKG